MPKRTIRIKVFSYDHRVLDNAVREIVDAVKKTGVKISGPVPLPTHVERFTVLRSPHADKRSMEQFEIRTHKRLIDILDPGPRAMEALRNLNVPAGVEIKVRA